MKRLSTENIRKEKSIQNSGFINIKAIPVLKRNHYFLIDIPLDGDAPKQYIKAYFYERKNQKTKAKNWQYYFAKYGSKSYPHESVIEYFINKTGEYLGLNMNETKLVIINEQIRFLSKDFIKKGKKLIHGIEILSEYFEDKLFVDEINKDRKSRREYFTFELIENAISHVYKNEAIALMRDLICLITFDAILGNNDRHFYNWGIIGNIKKKNSGVKFAPIYDSARGLFWNITEAGIFKMYRQFITDTSEIESYLHKSMPRFSFEGNPDSNHFELIQYLIGYNDEYRSIIAELISSEKEAFVINKIDQELRCLFSPERFMLMKAVIQLRFIKLRNLL